MQFSSTPFTCGSVKWGWPGERNNTRWCHGMERLGALLTLCEGNPHMDSPHKVPVMQSFDVFFVASLNKVWNKSWCRCHWYEMLFLWCHCSVYCWKTMMSQMKSVWYNKPQYAVHKKCRHDWCLVVALNLFCCGMKLFDFSPILQDYFIGTRAIIKKTPW